MSNLLLPTFFSVLSKCSCTFYLSNEIRHCVILFIHRMRHYVIIVIIYCSTSCFSFYRFHVHFQSFFSLLDYVTQNTIDSNGYCTKSLLSQSKLYYVVSNKLFNSALLPIPWLMLLWTLMSFLAPVDLCENFHRYWNISQCPFPFNLLSSFHTLSHSFS